MIFNLVCFIVLELGTGFCSTLPQLLGVRALYGIAMGVSISVRMRMVFLADFTSVCLGLQPRRL